jgi:hypothetical protein
MRVLHLVYIVFFLFLGAWLGQAILKQNPLRWAAVFVPLCAVMFYVQLRTFEGSGHFDWPGAAPRNPWVQAFLWARENTPVDAKFLVPFDFMRRPREDYYGFRAWAERSRTVDDVKDRAVAALSPPLADKWALEADLLRGEWKVTWILDTRAALSEQAHALSCPYANAVVMVCQVPAAPEQVPQAQR